MGIKNSRHMPLTWMTHLDNFNFTYRVTWLVGAMSR